MPDPDATSRYAHLINLCRDYQEMIDLIQSGTLETDEVRELNGQRSVLHEQVMEEMTRLGMPFADRVDAMRQAVKIARWLGME
jgi:cell division FtsZ-interacting protein ZapD